MRADSPSLSNHDRGARGLAEGDLLTVAQALQLVPIGKSMLHNLVAEGQIPAIRVRTLGSRRGRILIERAGRDKYVRNQLADHRKPAPILDLDAIHARVRRRLRSAQDVPYG